jgi:dTDP-4-dehydrorhamnose 3,5-epimerase
VFNGRRVKIEPLSIPEVLAITPTKHGDERGFFSEVYRHDALANYGVDLPFIQDNHVLSAARGVLRGLHFQVAPSAQGKLIRCTRGAVLDVAVDIRGGSPTFGRHVSIELSAINWRQVWVPRGFAHGYVTLEPDCEVIYKVTSYYDPASERGLAWDDPALAIDWWLPVDQLTLSPKDRANPILADLEAAFSYVDRRSAD